MGVREQQHAVQLRLPALAEDVGRARRHVEPDTSLFWALERIAGHVYALAWAFLEPTASELVAVTAPGDDDAIREALRLVDQRDNHWRRLLGEDPA